MKTSFVIIFTGLICLFQNLPAEETTTGSLEINSELNALDPTPAINEPGEAAVNAPVDTPAINEPTNDTAVNSAAKDSDVKDPNENVSVNSVKDATDANDSKAQIWTGPGFYYGVRFETVPEYWEWCRYHNRPYQRRH